VPPRRKILNVALHEAAAKYRAAIMGRAGFEVVPALNLTAVEQACKAHRTFDLALIGNALPNSEKRRVMQCIRKLSGAVPILELHDRREAPVDQEADEELSRFNDPDALVAKARELIARSKKKRRAASRGM